MDKEKIRELDKEIEKLKQQQYRLTKENDINIKKLNEDRLKLKEDIIPTHSILSQIHSKYFNMIIASFTLFSGLYALIEIIKWLEPNMNECQRYISLFFIAIFLLIAVGIYIIMYLKETNRFSKSLEALWNSYDNKINENNIEVKKYTSEFSKLQTQINKLETQKGTEAFVKKK